MSAIAADAQLKTTDPDFDFKLRKVLDNLAKQIGGEWRIERRTLELFRVEPDVATTAPTVR
jgi:hypothetical protein